MVEETEAPFFALDPVEVNIAFGAPRRQRRGSVALRGLLLVPLLAVVAALGIVCELLAVIGWFAALVLGRLPRWIAVFELKAISYSVGVNAYVFLVVDKYPPFAVSPPDYPLTVQIGASRLSRAKVFFRWLLAIPAGIVSGIAGGGLLVLSPVIWLVTLVRGRPPQPLFSAAAAVIRYQARYYAYVSLVTDMYPRRLFGDGQSDWVGGWVSEEEGERRRDFRLPLSDGARWLMRLIVVLGIVAPIASGVIQAELGSGSSSPLAAAEQRLEIASLTYVNSAQGCGSATALICEDTAGRVWARAFDRFAASLSSIAFPDYQRRQVSALIEDARRVGDGLRAASKSNTAAQYRKGFARVQRLLAAFEVDATRLLGHGL